MEKNHLKQQVNDRRTSSSTGPTTTYRIHVTRQRPTSDSESEWQRQRSGKGKNGIYLTKAYVPDILNVKKQMKPERNDTRV